MSEEIGNLHPDDYEMFRNAKQLAYRLADLIGEELSVFEPKRRPSTGTLGLCYTNERRISIRFRAKTGGKWWKYPESQETVFRTIAHEVAHLRHPNHSVNFKNLEKQLVGKI